MSIIENATFNFAFIYWIIPLFFGAIILILSIKKDITKLLRLFLVTKML